MTAHRPSKNITSADTQSQKKESRPSSTARRKQEGATHGREKRTGERRDASSAPRNERSERRDEEGFDRSGSKPRGAAGALIDLDKDLMKLLVRRATLVSRIRGGKNHAATPEAIQAEKAVRTAFEENALSFSKDPRFTRELFNLLQELTVLSKDEADSKPGFTLVPSRSLVSASLTAPVSQRASCLWMTLAAFRNSSVSLKHTMRSETLNACVKVLQQGGADVEWEKNSPPLGAIHLTAGSPPRYAGKTIYVGDSPLALYLTAFAAVASPGVTRLTGGAALKNTDLAGLRHTLPLLGARLAHVIPRSKGLPATLEASGMLPESLVVPHDLPLEGVCALLLAPLLWDGAITIDLSALPAAVATSALTEMSLLFADCRAEVESYGPKLEYARAPLAIPAEPKLFIEPTFAAYLLALPAFAKGEITLKGAWPAHLPEAHEALEVLHSCGVEVAVSPEAVLATHAPKDVAPLLPEDVSSELLPLLCALLAPGSIKEETAAPLVTESDDFALAQEFSARIGISLDPHHMKPAETPAPDTAWTAPDSHWGMAYALAAYVKPGIRLANPEIVTETAPIFWSIYNALPSPQDPAEHAPNDSKEKNNAAPTRRRFIAG